MHQACGYENKEQYNKSNAVLTGVIRDAFNNGVIDESLKNAIENFQIKLNNKQRYNAYYIRKNIPNSPIVEENLERNVVDDETTQFLVHTTKRINVDGLFVSRGITGVFDSQHGSVRDSRMSRGDMIILQLKKGHKIKHGNDITCIVCLCVGRKAFFLETEFTNRETIIVPIADSSPIVGFRGREAYEVSKYTFGYNQFV